MSKLLSHFSTKQLKRLQFYSEDIDQSSSSIIENQTTITCIACGQEDVPIQDYNRGSIICCRCGCVQDSPVLENKPPRSFKNDNKANPIVYNPEDIIYTPKSYIPNAFSNNVQPVYHNLLKVNDYYDLKEKKEKTMYDFLRFICNFYSLDRDTFLTAFKIYKIMEQNQIIKGSRVYAVSGLVMYEACLKQKKLVNLTEIAKAIQQYMSEKFTSKDVPKIRGSIFRLRDQIKQQGDRGDRTPLLPEAQLRKICFNLRNQAEIPLKIIDQVEAEAIQLFTRSRADLGFHGNLGSFTPAFVMYFLQQHNITITCTKIAKASKYTSPTIQTHYEKLLKYLKTHPQLLQK